MLEILTRFHESGVTQEELDHAISHHRGSSLYSQQAPWSLVRDWIWEDQMGHPHRYSERVTETAATMSLEEVNETIRRFYDPDEFSVVRIVNKE